MRLFLQLCLLWQKSVCLDFTCPLKAQQLRYCLAQKHQNLQDSMSSFLRVARCLRLPEADLSPSSLVASSGSFSSLTFEFSSLMSPETVEALTFSPCPSKYTNSYFQASRLYLQICSFLCRVSHSWGDVIRLSGPYAIRIITTMANDKMNQFLRDRKIKHRKVAGYRKQRIVKHYRKMQEDAPENDRTVEIDPQDEGAQRKIQYYKQVFSAPPAETAPAPKAAPAAAPVPQVDPSIAKLSQLKHKKQKYIRKMQKERTSKGQPVMRNYIKYALTKLEETLEREKKEKQTQKK